MVAVILGQNKEKKSNLELPLEIKYVHILSFTVSWLCSSLLS